MSAIAELQTLEQLLDRHSSILGTQLRSEIPLRVVPGDWPVHVLELGSAAADVPAVGFFAGVHGNERIGTQVLLAFLHGLLERLHWDDSLSTLLERLRVVFVPLVNPGGMALRQRATPAGIDLMRNAPVHSTEAHWLLGGQRLTRHLPWYRGPDDALAVENQVVEQVVRQRLLPAPFSLALDCHSGFGVRDSIWFPYAHSREPIPHLAEIYALRGLFRQTYPDHVTYRIEPQCRHYMTHGDIWDHLYLGSQQNAGRCFLPLTLEMGSWRWVKKNPRQIFTRAGLFDPRLPHRRRRTLRQHLLWLDFLLRAVAAHGRWLPQPDARAAVQREAWAYWGHHYQGRAQPLPRVPMA